MEGGDGVSIMGYFLLFFQKVLKKMEKYLEINYGIQYL
jgi:hypothetical protein